MAAFAKNRVLRLGPLLVVAFVVHAALGQTSLPKILTGFVLPTWPGVAWSITPELHFYVIFPFLLGLIRRFGVRIVLIFIAAAIGIRFAVWLTTGEVQHLAYRTIGGRADQFLWGTLFGYMASRNSVFFGWRRWIAPLAIVAFLLFWHQFNSWGGYYNLPTTPSPSPLWIVLPSIEGLAYAILIGWYAEVAFNIPKMIDHLLAWLGTVSFSIYIWHWLLLEPLAHILDVLGTPRATFEQASFTALIFFACVALLSGLSYSLIERPFLAMRVSYVRRRVPTRAEQTVHSSTQGGMN